MSRIVKIASFVGVMGIASNSIGADTGFRVDIGTTCRAMGGTPVRAALGISGTGWANDSKVQMMTVECPLPVNNGTTLKSADFAVVANHTGFVVTCSLNNTTNIQTNAGFSASASTDSSGASPNAVIINANITDSTPGYVWAQCLIPPKSPLGNRSGLIAINIKQ